MKIENSFTSNYYCEVLSELPPSNKKRFYFPGGIEAGGKDGLIVNVIPELGDAWIGVFAFGQISPKGVSVVCSCPQNSHICVISRGEGYIVNVNNPVDFNIIPIEPIIGVFSAPLKRLLIFYDFTRVLAYGYDGIVWKTPSLSWDGLSITQVTNDTIIGQAWDAPKGKEVNFEISLETGEHKGGASPELNG